MRIVVASNDDDARMMPAGLHDEIVQCFEIPVIAGQQHTALANCVREVNGVIRAGHSSVSRDLRIVVSLFQHSHEQGSGSIVVEVKVHQRIIWRRSCGDSDLGLPWYL